MRPVGHEFNLALLGCLQEPYLSVAHGTTGHSSEGAPGVVALSIIDSLLLNCFKSPQPDGVTVMLKATQLVSCLFVILGTGVAMAQSNGSVLFENAQVIVGDGSQLSSVDVLIGDGVIQGVGNLDGVTADTVVDLSGKTLMPALIDGHAHLGYQSYSGWGAEFYSEENLRANLEQYAYYGFSAVFSAGSDPDLLSLNFQLQQSAANQTSAEFLFAAGMAPPGQGPNNQFLVQTAQVEESTGMTILRGLSDPEQARAQVREVAELGIGFIKIWVDDRGGTQQKLAPEIYRAVADEAKQLGLQVFVHQQTAQDMTDLIAAGVNGFLHGRVGDDFTAALSSQAAAADVFIVPNLGLGELRREAIGADEFLVPFLNDEASARLGENALRSLNPLRLAGDEGAVASGLARFLAAGGQLVLGTDAGAVPDHPFGYTGHRELEIYVRLGVPPMVALQAATGNAARFLGLEDQGLLRTGYQADLIVLDGDPLQDIRNTRRIDSVYLDGQQVDREAIRRRISGR